MWAVAFQGGGIAPVVNTTSPTPGCPINPGFGDASAFTRFGANGYSCGEQPNGPFVFDLTHLEGCTDSEIILARTSAAQGDWITPGAITLNSSATTTVVAYPTPGWKDVQLDGAPYGNPNINFERFIDVYTTRELHQIVAQQGGIDRDTICQGSALSFFSTIIAGRFDDSNTLAYEWSFPGGTDASGNPISAATRAEADPSELIYFFTPGTYTIQLRTLHNCCGWSIPIEYTIEVLGPPTVTLNGPDEVCVNSPATYNAVQNNTPVDPNPEFRWFVNCTEIQGWTQASLGGDTFTSASLTDGDQVTVQIRNRAPYLCTFNDACTSPSGVADGSPVSTASRTITISDSSDAGIAFLSNNTTVQLDSICSGDAAELGLINYLGDIQWQRAPTAGGAYTDITGGVLDDVTLLSLQPTTDNFFRALVTNGGCPPDTSNLLEMRIRSGAIGGFATVAAADDTICSGEDASRFIGR